MTEIEPDFDLEKLMREVPYIQRFVLENRGFSRAVEQRDPDTLQFLAEVAQMIRANPDIERLIEMMRKRGWQQNYFDTDVLNGKGPEELYDPVDPERKHVVFEYDEGKIKLSRTTVLFASMRDDIVGTVSCDPVSRKVLVETEYKSGGRINQVLDFSTFVGAIDNYCGLPISDAALSGMYNADGTVKPVRVALKIGAETTLGFPDR